MSSPPTPPSPPLTVAPFDDVLTHVIEVILKQPLGSPIHGALLRAQIATFINFVSLSLTHLEDLQTIGATVWNDAVTKFKAGGRTAGTGPLPIGPKSLILWFQRFHREELVHKDGYALSNMTFWSTIGSAEFDTFRVTAPPDFSTRNHGPNSSSTNPTYKDLKLDLSHYDDLKSEEQWDTWHHSFKTFAAASGYGDLCDLKFKIPANGTSERAKWDNQQRHLYAVLLAKLPMVALSSKDMMVTHTAPIKLSLHTIRLPSWSTSTSAESLTSLLMPKLTALRSKAVPKNSSLNGNAKLLFFPPSMMEKPSLTLVSWSLF
mmetsp:Transcript_54976/g.133502  ORF Transcript_54976/g.133502 Transcript_54976/m.133502 type:complete len:318 (-) Transcript_54976:544-1497(-)